MDGLGWEPRQRRADESLSRAVPIRYALNFTKYIEETGALQLPPDTKSITEIVESLKYESANELVRRQRKESRADRVLRLLVVRAGRVEDAGPPVRARG